MLASVMQVLDTTIANVALPHIQSSLGATTDSVTWVLTSYMIASAVATPLTGWLADRIGGAAAVHVSVAAFILASMLCGVARTSNRWCLPHPAGHFRRLHGPAEPELHARCHPPSRHSLVMSIWSTGIMLGPIMGPLIGGWLTENWNWRFVFYVNLPVGLISLVILLIPSCRAAQEYTQVRHVRICLAVDRARLAATDARPGQPRRLVRCAGEIWIYAGLAISRFLDHRDPFPADQDSAAQPALFKDRNFAVATSFMIALGVDPVLDARADPADDAESARLYRDGHGAGADAARVRIDRQHA